MEESTVEKREFGFLWKIIGAFLFLIATNVIIKEYLCPCLGLYVSLGAMGGLSVLLTIIYAVKLKPALNQIILFLVSVNLTLASIVTFVYDLPCKKMVGFVSIPFVLFLCGMWIYTRFDKVEIK